MFEEHTAKIYKTEHFSGEQIRQLQETANEQNRRIARIFYKNPGNAFGPTRIHAMLFPGFPDRRGDWAITSTRRAINNLTEDRILRKTDKVSTSLLNGTEHQWTWRNPHTHPITHREMVEAQRKNGQTNFYDQMFKKDEL